MWRPLKAWATRLTPSAPTGAVTLTGTIRLAARAKYTADPPRTSSTLPNGPSRVSSATEPATRRCGRASGTSAGSAVRRDDVARRPQLLQEVHRARELFDLHPASSQLLCSMRVRARRRDLFQLRSEARRGLVFGRLAPSVVRLDDVDPICELDDALDSKVGAMAVQRMRYVRETSHLVNQVHHLFRPQIRRQPPCDEQYDHFAFASLGLFADDGKLRCQLGQREGAFDGVVVGQRNPVEADLGAPLDQFLERALTVV